MERSLGLMCGAGPLPARMAETARRDGWRVVAFTFADAPGVDRHAERVVPSRFTEIGPVLAAVKAEGLSAALFSGKFSMTEVLRADAGRADAVSRGVGERAGSRIDARLVEVIIATFAGIGVEVLDQRPFVGDWLAAGGCWSARRPTDSEWAEARRGLDLARVIAEAGIGQTIVLRHGAVAAVEAVEGTTETIRRGTALGGPGAVIVKAVARAHDYRFDTPAVGPETVDVAAAGGAAVLAVETGRVLVVDRERTVAAADGAGLVLLGIGDGGRE